MQHLDPYAPIEKRQLITPDGMESRGYTVRRTDPDAESGWKECGIVSQDYLLVPNAEVFRLAHEIADRTALHFQEDKVFFDGKRYLYGLVAKERCLIDVKVGDPVGIGLLFENSYDGSRQLSAGIYIHRLACSNGMIVPRLFRQVRFRHDQTAHGWEDGIRDALSMIRYATEGLLRFKNAVEQLSSMRMNASRLRTIRGEVLPKLAVTLWGKMMDRLLEHETLDGWGLLNAGTNVVWHDGKPTASNFKWNEYVSTQLVQYALDQSEGDRRN